MQSHMRCLIMDFKFVCKLQINLWQLKKVHFYMEQVPCMTTRKGFSFALSHTVKTIPVQKICGN